MWLLAPWLPHCTAWFGWRLPWGREIPYCSRYFKKIFTAILHVIGNQLLSPSEKKALKYRGAYSIAGKHVLVIFVIVVVLETGASFCRKWFLSWKTFSLNGGDKQKLLGLIEPCRSKIAHQRANGGQQCNWGHRDASVHLAASISLSSYTMWGPVNVLVFKGHKIELVSVSQCLQSWCTLQAESFGVWISCVKSG